MIFRRPLSSSPFGWRNAFSELDRMQRQLQELAGGLAKRPRWPVGAGVFPLINLTADKDNYYVRAELPGLKADDINISVANNNLSISGERKIASEGENVRYHRREREAGTFSRIIALPGDVDTAKVEASHVNGILTVVVPKAEAAKPKQITVN